MPPSAIAFVSDILNGIAVNDGSTAVVLAGIALCTFSNILANRGVDRERARRLACDRASELEIRGQATVKEDRLLELHLQVTRQKAPSSSMD